MSKIYLLIGKIVGYEILKYLTEQKYEITFICVSTENDIEIIEYCKTHKLSFHIYDKSIFEELLSEKYEEGWLINAWSPHLIPQEILTKFHRNLNLHPSFVPFGKGSDSATWAIRENTKAGVSLITITSELDKGDIYAQKIVNYDIDTTAEFLTSLLKVELISLFTEKWKYIYLEKLTPIPQPLNIGSIHKKSETRLDRIKKISDFDNVLDFLKWSNSHNFSKKSLPVIIIGSNSYALEIKINKIKNI